ncbi:hypothetical protein GGI35DRAFT_92410 [Trichoderma velutinum]
MSQFCGPREKGGCIADMSLQVRCHHTQSSRGSATHPKQTIDSQNLARGAHRKQTSHDDTRHLRASDDLRPGRDAFIIILISVPSEKYPCHLQMSPKYLPLPCFQPRACFHITQKGKLSGMILLPVKPQRLNAAAKKTKSGEACKAKSTLVWNSQLRGEEDEPCPPL